MSDNLLRVSCPVCKTSRHISVVDENKNNQDLWSVRCRKCLRKSSHESLESAITDFNSLKEETPTSNSEIAETMFIEHVPVMTSNIFRLLYYYTSITSDEKWFAWEARESWKFFEGIAEAYKKTGVYSKDITALCFESLIGMLGKVKGIHLYEEKDQEKPSDE